jgi:hypothetical protein
MIRADLEQKIAGNLAEIKDYNIIGRCQSLIFYCGQPQTMPDNEIMGFDDRVQKIVARKTYSKDDLLVVHTEARLSDERYPDINEIKVNYHGADVFHAKQISKAHLSQPGVISLEHDKKMYQILKYEAAEAWEDQLYHLTEEAPHEDMRNASLVFGKLE